MANHEMYEYPGKFVDQDTGKRLSRLRIEMEEAHQRRVLGTGRCGGFDPGRRFTVGAARGGRPTTYLLTEVRHHGTAPGAEADGAEANYTNDFVAIPVDLPFRPERLTPKPFVHSAQTATVVGPPGESIFCDPYGRVRVQFHWDRRGQRNHQSSCWMRVAQTRAGSFYGSQVIPHVGHEVIVSFLEGDPDRPLITGSVPNALTMPPMELPADKHKTIQRDHGDNKLVMNGKPGGERMSMISPRAVNLFASGPSARPLSSYATVKPPPATSGSTLAFYSDPQSYTLTTIPGKQTQGSVASGQTATTANIPTYKDAEGLTELWNEWYGTTQSDIDNSSPITDPSTAAGNAGSYGTQDGTAANSYLNWGSQGRINCLTLGNNNLWVNLDNNAWINGSVNTQINGDSTTVIGGTKLPAQWAVDQPLHGYDDSLGSEHQRGDGRQYFIRPGFKQQLRWSKQYKCHRRLERVYGYRREFLFEYRRYQYRQHRIVEHHDNGGCRCEDLHWPETRQFFRQNVHRSNGDEDRAYAYEGRRSIDK